MTEIPVQATEFRFEPASLTVKKGQRVRIKLENRGTQLHDFSADAPTERVIARSTGDHAHETPPAKLHVSAAPGKAGTLTFTATATGTFPFWCSVSGHREAGMVRQMTVQ